MADDPEESKIRALHYNYQLQSHYEMARRIEKIAVESDFIDTVAREGIVGLKAMMLRAMGDSDERHSEWEKAIVDMETKKAQSYPKTIVNQSLVLMCTTLDTFLQTSMEVILRLDAGSVHALCDDKDINVHDVIKYNQGEGAIAQIRRKILDRFDHAGIEAKIKALGKCSINMDKVLSGSGVYPLRHDSTHGMNLLKSAYQKRHSIVHKGAVPIARSDDLHEYSNYFTSFILSFAEVCSQDKGVPTDLISLLTVASKTPANQSLSH